MIHNEDSVLLSQYCFNICETLNATIRGKSTDDLDKSMRTALDDLERCVHPPLPHLPPSQQIRSRVMCKIELTLRRGTNLPHVEYGKVDEHKREIQQILSVLNAQSSPFDENPAVGKPAPPVWPQLTRRTSGSKGGAF